MSPVTSSSNNNVPVRHKNNSQSDQPVVASSSMSSSQTRRHRRSIDGPSHHKRTGSRRGSNHQQNQSTRRTTSGSINNNSDMRSSFNADDADFKSCNRFGSEKRTSIQSNLSSVTATTTTTSSSLSSNSSSTHRNISSQLDDNNSGQTSAPMSNIEYENLRNSTVLYFLDRLYRESRDGKEPRTLHELSCLFGTKEFTKEMRQIVGASRNGLKKFLESYPSLFTIEDDKVYVTQLKQDAQKPTRDYDKEACDYFSEKLKQFGTPFVPIKNLFGYRSQASQEIRHVSGRNARDFKQFLLNNDHVFEVLVDEHVVLRSALKELESKGESNAIVSLREQQHQQETQDNVMIDPYLNKRFAHLVEDCLKRMQQQENESKTAFDKSNSHDESKVVRFELEQLHERIKQDCNNQLFLKMVKTIDDLKVFLRMHPKLFKRIKCQEDPNKEYVSLLTDEERSEMIKMQTYSTQRLLRQHSTLGSVDESGFMSLQATIGLSTTDKPQKEDLPVKTTDAKISAEAKPSDKIATANTSTQAKPDSTSLLTTGEPSTKHKSEQEPMKHQTTTATTTTTKQPLTRQSSSSAISSQLRSTAPPFIPADRRRDSNLSSETRTDKQNLPPQVQPAPQPLQRSMSSVTSGSRIANDSRQALHNYLLKASETNSTIGQGNTGMARNNNVNINKRLAAHPPHPPAVKTNPHYLPGPQVTNGFTAIHANNNNDDLRARTVDIVCEASNIISHIMNTTDAIAFDCKGYNLGSDGQITLIQLGYLPSNDTQDDLDNNMRHLGYENQKNSANNNNNEKTSDGLTDSSQPIRKPEVCVFDLITNPELAHCLKPLLESNKIIKIAHDVRNKSNALYSRFKIVLKNVFDTQVANLVIQQQETGRPAYKSRYISMSKLCELYGNEELLNYREIIKSKTKHINGGCPSSINSSNYNQRNNGMNNDKGVNYWRSRPLTKAMIFSATVDVYCLIGGIYHNLKSKIKPEYEPLFEQLNYENVLARIKPDEIKSVKNERKIDLEVIDLKRKLYSDTKSLIVLSNREIRLLRHIELTPEVRQKIQQCKKVAKKLERLDMKAAQMLESMTSQVTSTTDPETTNGDANQTSLDDRTVTTDDQLSSLSSSKATNGCSTNQPGLDDDDINNDCDAEFSEDRLNNLMDGSMFDELKDKMIESSSLLESLEDDDDVETDPNFKASHIRDQERSRSLQTHSHNSDCCHCQCHHRNSLDATPDQANNQAIPGQKEVSSTGSSAIDSSLNKRTDI